MKGWFSAGALPGEALDSYREAASAGEAANSAIEFTLTIFSHDLDELLNDLKHPAKLSGTVECKALSEQPLSVSDGVFNLFEKMPSPPDTRHMIYSMVLTAGNGEQFFFKGYKVVKDDPEVLDIWPDTSTLYVSVQRGDSESGGLVGKAVLHIEPEDFAKQMTTMEITGTTEPLKKLEALAQFGKFFAGVLYESYGGVFYNPNAKAPRPPRKKRPLRAPAPAVHAFTTHDGVELRLTRYQGGTKGPVMLVHGLGVASRQVVRQSAVGICHGGSAGLLQ